MVKISFYKEREGNPESNSLHFLNQPYLDVSMSNHNNYYNALYVHHMYTCHSLNGKLRVTNVQI